jgi:hypothetical protein
MFETGNSLKQLAPTPLKKCYWKFLGHYSHLKRMYDLVGPLRDFFRDRVTLQRAEEEIKRALETREERFLELIRTQVYERPSSPYLKLLKLAGCEFSDLGTQVHRHGLEGTLERLAREGVYLTAGEFKGKKEVLRGRQSFRVSPGDFERLDSSAGFITQSSGTTNRPVHSLISLDWLAIRTLGMGVFFSAHDLFSHSHALYEAVLPVGTGVNNLLYHAKFGIRTDRWFARKVPVNTRLEGRYHFLTTYLIVLTGKWFGPGLPKPEFIDIGDICRIVRWVLQNHREGKACCITTAASNGARIARVAWEMGVSLEGTKFIVTGEPFTESKREVIERVGASATPRYAYGGGLSVGLGCANPLNTDEVHVNQHMLAVIPHPRSLNKDGLAIHSLLLTTLHPSAPRLLLNVDNGDYATLERRDCGCALEKVGLTLHLHHIRSYEKFTSEGMNYFYGDLFELLEENLPSEFGGGPGDYQLVEEEDANGQTRITLRVHPQIGPVDERRLLSRLQAGLAKGSWGNQFQAGIWQDAGTLGIKREVPHASPRGKILPLHIRH